jgi:hypothetical protein
MHFSYSRILVAMKKLVYIVALGLVLVGCKSKQQERAEVAVQEYMQLKAQAGGVGYKPISSESQPKQQGKMRGYEVVHEFSSLASDGQNSIGQVTLFVDSVGNVSDAKN